MDGEQISIQPEIWLDNEDEKVLKNNANEVWVVGEVELTHGREFRHLARSKGHSAPLSGNADLPLPRTDSTVYFVRTVNALACVAGVFPALSDFSRLPL